MAAEAAAALEIFFFVCTTHGQEFRVADHTLFLLLLPRFPFYMFFRGLTRGVQCPKEKGTSHVR